MITGIIPLNKPRGMTSFDCVSKMRRIMGQKKVGHSGTLDPNVDGVLPICLGHATKVVDYLMQSGKSYRGEITLGFATSTEDLDGDIIETNFDFEPLTDEQINRTLDSFLGETIQIPPMFSAVKVNGRRLYDYARHGETVERPERTITISAFRQIKPAEYNFVNKTQTIYFQVDCGKGTYVRTLATDFGRKVGMPAVMSDLTRYESGGFKLDQAVTFEQIEASKAAGTLNQLIYPISHALDQFPSAELSEEQWGHVQHGGFLSPEELACRDEQVVLKYNDRDRALYYFNEAQNLFKPKKMFDLE